MENGRIGEIVFNPIDQSLMGVRHENGIATLVRVPKPYDTWYRVYGFPYGVVPYDLDMSPDGRLLSGSVAEVNGDQFLRVWEIEKLLAGDITPLSEFRFGQSVPESFVFSRDGRYLYGSSYYTGVSNIFRYEVATGAIEAVSNAETGFFRPVPLADGRLVVLNYTGEGFVPAIIEPRPIADVSAITFLGTELVEKYPVIKTWQVASPSTVDDEKLITAKGSLRARGATLGSPMPIRYCRATRTTSGSATTSTSTIRCSSRASESPPPIRRATACPATSAATSTSPADTSSGRGAVVEPLGLLRPLRPD